MNYIERVLDGVQGVFNVNPSTLSGAIDVVAVRQPPAPSSPSSPSSSSQPGAPRILSTAFHVRFGKLQILHPHEKIVKVYVNGKETALKMKLGAAGEAFFVEEADEAERASLLAEQATSPMPTPPSTPCLSPALPEGPASAPAPALAVSAPIAIGQQQQQVVSPLAASPAASSGPPLLVPAAVQAALTPGADPVPLTSLLEKVIEQRQQEAAGAGADPAEADALASQSQDPLPPLILDGGGSQRGHHKSASAIPSATGRGGGGWRSVFQYLRPGSSSSSSTAPQQPQPEEKRPESAPPQPQPQQAAAQDGVAASASSTTAAVAADAADAGPDGEQKPGATQQQQQQQQEALLQDPRLAAMVAAEKVDGSAGRGDDDDTNASGGGDEDTEDDDDDDDFADAPEFALEIDGAQSLPLPPDGLAQPPPSLPQPRPVSPAVAKIPGIEVTSPMAVPRPGDGGALSPIVLSPPTPSRISLAKGGKPTPPLSPGFGATPVLSPSSSPPLSPLGRDTVSNAELCGLSVQMSLCAEQLAAASTDLDEQGIAAIFDAGVLTFEQLAANPAVLLDPNAMCRINGRLYPPGVAAALLSSIVLFRRRLDPAVALSSLAGVVVPQQMDAMSKKRRWRLGWPFPAKPSAASAPAQQQAGAAAAAAEAKVYKKALVPTSRQLEELELRDGANEITFAVLSGTARREVKSYLYVMGHDAKVVVSDIDGTITKSDALGHIFTVLGRDWSQSGVAQLYTAIAANGYHIVYLSSRAIGQAQYTRDFIQGLKQPGEPGAATSPVLASSPPPGPAADAQATLFKMPQGPVLLSPFRLLSAMDKEVIRRTPQEFKIACLTEVQKLFPESSKPFYAGFGNRKTDVMAYSHVGIPEGKIFTINHLGRIRTSNRTYQKSYTKLHELVDEMFPAGGGLDDQYSDMNYWSLPLPKIP
eukprot:m51a1_g9367 putative phosphatidate phosphatase pah1 (930) ;mRNA; r:183131-186120